MFLESINSFCLSKQGVEATFPFDEKTIVWKVLGKMFCLGDTDNFSQITVKCNPEDSEKFQEQYEQIKPGYHMNKKLWISVELEGLDSEFVFSLIETSYKLVVQKLPKKEQLLLETL